MRPASKAQIVHTTCLSAGDVPSSSRSVLQDGRAKIAHTNRHKRYMQLAAGHLFDDTARRILITNTKRRNVRHAEQAAVMLLLQHKICPSPPRAFLRFINQAVRTKAAIRTAM